MQPESLFIQQNSLLLLLLLLLNHFNIAAALAESF